ncbi:uncharacterized protein At5g41620-like [Mercurialis annua]|uniref:uncharacterized protein At5g41620-like n=1 Tax=Mercurialis annua TaxID=3986 RepID=UPI00215EB102|nr:uncharacterized protein At5g41620-like [Mercurialis annua]
MAERQRNGKKNEETEPKKKSKTNLKFNGGLILVGKTGGPSTPSPTWRLELSSLEANNNNPIQEFLNTNSNVSARKLCANLWEIQPHLQFPLSKTPHNLGPKKKNIEPTHLVDPPNSPPHQQAREIPSKRRVAQQTNQHRSSVDRKGHALKPLSSASCDSSMEVVPYNPRTAPNRSLDLKGKMVGSSYSLKTSEELLKILNRIWSLEEKQSCNMSSSKSLKLELQHSQLQIKELLKERESNRQEMNDIMKEVAEDKVVRKNKMQDRIKDVIQSAQKELDSERKLRKYVESQDRKLARELSEVKNGFSNALKELERERKARILLENLCDEFAEGIRDYEQEVRSLMHKPEMHHIGCGKPDSLVLHISEAWLDERMQMRLADANNDSTENNTIVDKLSLDIETFLEARHHNGLEKDDRFGNEAINNRSRRESFLLNETLSAPRDGGDSGSRFEQMKSAGKRQSTCNSTRAGIMPSECYLEEKMNSKPMKRKGGLRKNNIAALQARFSLNRNQSTSSEGDRIHPESEIKEDTCVEPVLASPVQKWMSKLASPEFDKSETLKEKLLEARLEGQKSRSRIAKAVF